MYILNLTAFQVAITGDIAQVANEKLLIVTLHTNFVYSFT